MMASSSIAWRTYPCVALATTYPTFPTILIRWQDNEKSTDFALCQTLLLYNKVFFQNNVNGTGWDREMRVITVLVSDKGGS